MLHRWRNRDKGWDQLRGMGALSHRLRKLTALERLVEARAFVEAFMWSETGTNPAFQRRWAEVRRDLIRHGFYEHTPEEIAFGAKLAWRNHARCIGRLFWEGLATRDCRHVTGPEEMFEDLCNHLADATGDGRVNSIISVYPPARPGQRPCYVESPQLTRYAGHLKRNGQVVGDRKAIDATRIARSFGWRPAAEPGQFDLLPVFFRDAQDRRHLFNLPPHVVREVAITHPEHSGLESMGLKWYAVPVVSDMILSIGGIDYPCAPFNGFYMCTEIASRNLADKTRYDLLSDVARCFGLDPDKATFWQDTALTELNRAVVHSYQAAGVTIVDHHTASDQFMRFRARETSAGRTVSAEWAWVVPPQASSACEVFHFGMDDLRTVPNFYRSRATDGKGLRPRLDLRQAPVLHRCVQAARRRGYLGSDSG